nr:hypothetical protein [Tanacetum cinerariifolium]
GYCSAIYDGCSSEILFGPSSLLSTIISLEGIPSSKSLVIKAATSDTVGALYCRVDEMLKKVPKTFYPKTNLDEDGYPVYRHRDSKIHAVKSGYCSAIYDGCSSEILFGPSSLLSTIISLEGIPSLKSLVIKAATSDTVGALYCRVDGKENGVNILKSIDEGPYQMGTVREPFVEGTEGAPHLGPERTRVYSDLCPEENDRYNADIRATNILLQGLPKDIYTLINHYTDAKDIWDNVKMLLEGSELTKEDQESQLYDDFEHFRQHKGETIHDYYVRFTKVINDMRNIKMTMSRMQLNSKFVNNMLPEWGRFVTAINLNKGLRDSNYDQLYAYLKQHETYAKENKMMLERFSQNTVDPLALMSNVSNQQCYSPLSSTSSSTHVAQQLADNAHLDSSLSLTENLIENLTNTLGQQNIGQGMNPRGGGAAGYGGVQNRVRNANPGQARHVKFYNCNGVGQIARNYTQPKRGKDNAIDDDFDEQPVQDLALNVDNVFQDEYCDAFDSDVDEAPTAQTMFMAICHLRILLLMKPDHHMIRTFYLRYKTMITTRMLYVHIMKNT